MKHLAIADNAMFYKDITQWIRQRSFGGLFFILLTLGLGTCLLMSFLPIGERAGISAFSTLAVILGIYMLIIGATGHFTTGREFQDRTFELYALAGMSLERMVLGKLASLLGQLLFGVACLAPYLFFAYLLGGIDFYQIFALLIVFALIALPLYQFGLLSALYSHTIKAARALVRLGMVLSILFIVPMLFNVMVFFFALGGMRGSSGFMPGDLISALGRGDFEAWLGTLTGLAHYILFNLLLFYLSAHALRPPTDTRELPIRLVLFLGSLLNVIGVMLMPVKHAETGVPVAIYGFIVMLILSIFSFYSRLNVPLMARRRAAAARPQTRPIHWVLQPGPAGLLRTLTLFWLLYAGFYLVESVYQTVPTKYANITTLPLMAPFFLIFPAGLLYNFRKLARQPSLLRNSVFGYWAVSGATLLIALNWVLRFRDNVETPLHYAAFILAFLLSPISTLVTGWGVGSDIELALPRIVLGALGLVLMARTLARRRRVELLPDNAEEPPAGPPPAITARPKNFRAATPPPIPAALRATEDLPPAEAPASEPAP